MDFIVFPVNTTSIFPLANSTQGGQLLTEYNQKTRESVANHSNIPYICGPSYTHSLDDFVLSSSGSTLYISGGIALVNGHFIHFDNSSNQAISIDLSGKGMNGALCVGLRAMYNNPDTIAATMKVENGDDFYEGIQVVILPKTSFLLPEDNGSGGSTPEDQVTAHLKLGELTFQDGVIKDLRSNDDRNKCIDGDKISNIDALLSDRYVTKTGLSDRKLYVMSGKQKADNTLTADYWADGTGSLMVWDANPQSRKVTDTVKPVWLKNQSITGNEIIDEAVVRYDAADDTTKLVLPHKQIDGMKDTNNDPAYYEPKEVPIPAANRATGAGGVLNRSWVNFLNGLDSKIATMYRTPGGKMRKFIEVLTNKSELPQPPIAYYTEQTRQVAYYDTRLQYSFNLLQTQLAQLNSKFMDFESKLESEWKDSVASDVSSNVQNQANIIQGDIEAVRSDVANLQSVVSGYQGDISSISDSISVSGAALDSHLEAYKNLADRVTRLENGADVSPAVSSDPVQDQIDELKLELTALQTDVASQTSEWETLKTNINARLSTAMNNLNALNQSLYGSTGNSGDVQDARASIQQLRDQYDYLYDAIHDLYDGIEAQVQKATTTAYSQLLSSLKTTLESEIASLAEQYNVTANWSPGDYVLVAQDQTVVSNTSSDNTSFPSTMYVVVPGMTPLDSKYVASYYDVYTTDLSTPINQVSSSSSTSSKDEYSDALNTYNNAVATLKRQVPSKFVYGYELGSNDVQELNSEDELPDVYNSTVMLDELYNSDVLIEGVRGTPGKDYFVLRYRYPKPNTPTGTRYVDEISGDSYENIQYQVYTWVSVFFTLNLVSDKIELDVDNPIILSGSTPYAEEARVGGFLNVSPDVYGGGYVSRDETGHLRLNDFEFLAAGVSAYQLGEDRVEGAGLDISELQDVFDQYVNQRIAFPNDAQLYKAAENHLRTDVITIELNINSTSEGTLNIYDIDSRFNTAVHLKITGNATENVLINITNCQRLRISMDPTSAPTIFLKNVCLYYDSDIIDRIAQIEGLTLWYTQFEDVDPQLEVDGMTVIYQGKLEPKGTKNFWTQASGNDNSYAYALRQITLASDGTVIGMGVAVTDNSTNNVNISSESIFASTFTLPQSIGLSYPVTRLTKQLKVTGNFITAYRTTDSGSGVSGYSVKNTNFTILTQKYLTYTDVREFIQGVISFYTKTSFVQDVEGVDGDTLLALGDEFAIDGWESGSYHIFYGGAIE